MQCSDHILAGMLLRRRRSDLKITGNSRERRSRQYQQSRLEIQIQKIQAQRPLRMLEAPAALWLDAEHGRCHLQEYPNMHKIQISFSVNCNTPRSSSVAILEQRKSRSSTSAKDEGALLPGWLSAFALLFRTPPTSASSTQPCCNYQTRQTCCTCAAFTWDSTIQVRMSNPSASGNWICNVDHTFTETELQ